MIKPWGDAIVIKLPKQQERLVRSGLWVPPEAQEPAPEALVLAVGPGPMASALAEDGLKPGVRIFFEQWAGLETTDKDWGDVIIIKPEDVKAILS